MNKTYHVYTFTGKTWENFNNNKFTSREKAEAHLNEWNTTDPDNMHRIFVFCNIEDKKGIKGKIARRSNTHTEMH